MQQIAPPSGISPRLAAYVVGQDAAALDGLAEQLRAHGFAVPGSATVDLLDSDAVGGANPDFVLLDLDTLDHAAARACATVIAGVVERPILLVTAKPVSGLIDPQDRPRAIGSLTKPLIAGELRATVDLGLQVFHLERALAETYTRLERQSRAAEQHRADDEEGFEAFARIGADWFWKSDADGRFTYFAGGKEETETLRMRRLGRTRRQAAAQDTENLARIDELDAIIARREPFREFAYRAHVTAERSAWCIVSGEPIYGPDGAYLGYRGIGRNVNTEVETQLALQEKTRILDAVFASVPDALRILGTDGRTVTVNEQFYTLFQFDKEAPLCVKGPDRIGRNAARRVAEPRYARGAGAALGAVGGAGLASRTSCR
jgi:PAS domain-containing protein/AmiR/NasT family two-component response regulator